MFRHWGCFGQFGRAERSRPAELRLWLRFVHPSSFIRSPDPLHRFSEQSLLQLSIGSTQEVGDLSGQYV